MKRKMLKWLSLFAIIGIASCSQEEPLNGSSRTIQNENSGQDERISVDEALEMAANAFYEFNDDKTRAQKSFALTSENVAYVTNDKTRAANDTILYIVNYPDSLGVAVISSRRIVTPLLAVTEKGTIDDLSHIQNPGMKIFMEHAIAYASTAPLEDEGRTRVGSIVDNLYEYKTEQESTNLACEPRVKVEWGQTGIYGEFCPNGVAGCSNTAAAMIMSYFELPTSIVLNQLRPAASIALPWGEMKQHVKGTQDNTCAAGVHTVISFLFYELGYRSSSSYNVSSAGNSTSTAVSKTRSTLSDLGFNVGTVTSYKYNALYSNLGAGVMFMYGSSSDGGGAHAWVGDGYKGTHNVARELRKRKDEFMWTEISRTDVTTIYNHFNWGWNGLYNGYFLDGTFGNYGDNVGYFMVNKK